LIALCCPVRGCGAALARAECALVCPRGHAFDRARSGYWNLLQPQDRRSPTPGDAPAAVAARRRWIDAGLADPLLAGVSDVLAGLGLPQRPGIVDLGCGDGAAIVRIVGERDVELCGIDLSVSAVSRAARLRPSATWIVANADRRLPLVDRAVDVAVSLFGRRNGSEIRRVLAPEAPLVVVVPGDDDLIELRQAVQGEGRVRDRVAATCAALAADFALERRRTVRWRSPLAAVAIADALALTYRGARHRERERAAGLGGLEVTLSAEILCLRSR
jgi:23S rRNA (guanine745-N1)-methyltransferase